MNDNLEPLKTQILDYFEQRGLNHGDPGPDLDVFRWYAARTQPELMADFEKLYYEAHKHWLFAHYRSGKCGWPFELSAEKLAQCIKAYSADTFPRLRGIITHANNLWFISGAMYLGKYATICNARRLVPGNQNLGIEPGHDYYGGKIVTHRGHEYTVTTKHAVFYTMDNDVHAPQQEGLF